MRMAKTLITLLLAVAAVMSAGCAKEKRNGVPQPPVGGFPLYGPWIPPGSGPGLLPGIDWEYGGTADLIVSAQAMNAYLGGTPNNLEDVRINLNLRKYGNGYGGVVTIGFKENGISYEDTFSSLVNPLGMVTTNEENHKYNIWFTKNGKSYWHGFFEHCFLTNYGYYNCASLVVVIDEFIDLNNGQGPISASGEVWFRNAPLTYAPPSPTSCWFVSRGPYDCRTWKSGKGVDTTMSPYPIADDHQYGHHYQKLGEFIDLDFKKAFNNEL